jgi:hypothetical protein
MAIEITKANDVQITNTKLRNYTEQIFKQGLSIKKSFAKIATILVKIEDSKCYEADGYESVQDYALKVLGWKSANTYAMLKVGRDYLDPKTAESVLPHETGNDYSTSQLQALLPLKSVDTAKDLAGNGEISPDMTVKEIKNVVKTFKAGTTKSEGEDTNKETSENNDDKDAIEIPAWSILYSFEIMQDAKNGNITFMLDGEETSKNSIIDILKKF